MNIVTAAQMQALDRRTIAEARIPGISLMERAAKALVTSVEQPFGPFEAKRIVVFAGKGNNGGDGLAAARLLHRRGARVRVLLLAPATGLSRDATVMHRRFMRVAGKSAIVPFEASVARVALTDNDFVIDALLGTGLSAEVTGQYRAAIDLMNESGKPIVAVDIPSGIHADSGSVLGVAVRASLTVTFGLPKLGLYLGAGIDHAGRVCIADIGIPSVYVDALERHTVLLTNGSVKQTLPSRPLSAHKGMFGHAGIIAGSVGKTGAAVMAAAAALRMGAGLVTVAAPVSVNDVLEAKLLEAMTIPLAETPARTLARSSLDEIVTFMQARTAVAIGPGLSTNPETVQLVQSLISRLDRPSVLDADALNALAHRTSVLSECKVTPILTPHPGEMARLETGLTAQMVNADRIGIARRFAREHNVYLVLKGARTLIARPDGLVAICPTGNPGMATAGTGDVLTGMIVGLLAQGVPAWDAACAATYIHGAAGDLAAQKLGQVSMLAGDVIAHIPNALQKINREE